MTMTITIARESMTSIFFTLNLLLLITQLFSLPLSKEAFAQDCSKRSITFASEDWLPLFKREKTLITNFRLAFLLLLLLLLLLFLLLLIKTAVSLLATGFVQPAQLLKYEDSLYIADKSANQIWRYDLTAKSKDLWLGSPTQSAGDILGTGTAAMLNGPRGITLDYTQEFFLVSEYSGEYIRRVAISNATVMSFIGNGVGATVDGPSASAQVNGKANTPSFTPSSIPFFFLTFKHRPMLFMDRHDEQHHGICRRSWRYNPNYISELYDNIEEGIIWRDRPIVKTFSKKKNSKRPSLRWRGSLASLELQTETL